VRSNAPDGAGRRGDNRKGKARQGQEERRKMASFPVEKQLFSQKLTQIFVKKALISDFSGKKCDFLPQK